MKLILLLGALMGAIAVGVFALTLQRESAPAQDTPSANGGPEENGTFEVTELLARTVIQNALDEQFDKTAATYAVLNLENQEDPILIIGAAEPIAEFSARTNSALVLVVRVLNATGSYERLGSVTYREPLRDVPHVRELQDITGDGKEEIFVSLGYGGASNAAYGFLELAPQEKTLKWIQLQDQSGHTRDAIFLMGGTVTHTETVEVVDISGDGVPEIVEIFSQIWKPEGQENAIPQRQLGDTWCLARAYQWSGSLFDFTRALSEQFLASLDSNCAM